MAWYYGKFACGCEGRVNITGPIKNREWKKQIAFEKECGDCYRERLEKEREEDNKKAIELAKEMELPDLEGTEKQVAWANTIRQDFIDEYEIFIEKGDLGGLSKENIKRVEDKNKLYLVMDYLLTEKLNSKFWIEHRDDIRWDRIDCILDKYIKKALPTDDETKEMIIKNDIDLESTISPKNATKPGIVEINVVDEGKAVELTYQKDCDFIELVKGLGFRWRNVWRRNINELTGSYKDRMAEIGNELLNNGFRIKIYEEQIRMMAVRGDFEREHYRWISFDATENKFKFHWEYGNDRLFNIIKKIPGTKYGSGSFKADLCNYEAIEEFAELYDFRFTERAINEVEHYIKEIEKISIVEPTRVEKTEIKEKGVEEILNSSKEILEDLLDD